MTYDDELDEALGDVHRRLDLDEWRDVYLVGDVHGCRGELEALIDRINPCPEDLLVFVGDLIRKGPDSRGVLERVRDMPNAVSVMGNNEAKVRRGTVEDPGLGHARSYLDELPVAISFGDALVVHGGVDPRERLSDQSAETFLTTRAIPDGAGYAGPFWFESYEGPPRVFFGHTVVDDVVKTDWSVGLDTGCVYGGSLTAYDYERAEVIQVPARRTYQRRSEEKVLEPTEVAP